MLYPSRCDKTNGTASRTGDRNYDPHHPITVNLSMLEVLINSVNFWQKIVIESHGIQDDEHGSSFGYAYAIEPFA